MALRPAGWLWMMALGLCACATARPVETEEPSAPPESAEQVPLYPTLPSEPYTVIGPAYAERRFRLGQNPREADESLRAALQAQAFAAKADAVVDVTFEESARWLPPLPDTTQLRREVKRSARGTLIRLGEPRLQARGAGSSSVPP